MWEFSAQLLVLSSYILKNFTVHVLQFVSAINCNQLQWTMHHLHFTYTKNHHDWLALMQMRKKMPITQLLATRLSYNRQKVILLHARKSSLNRHYKISLLNCSVHVSQYDSLCTQEWLCGVWPAGFPKQRSESLCAGQQKSAEMLLRVEHSNYVKWSIWLFERELSFQSENLKYLNWII